MTKTEYARCRGVDKSYLSKRNIKAMLEPAMEVCPRSGVLKINMEKADALFNQNIDQGGRGFMRARGNRPRGMLHDNSYVDVRRQNEEVKLQIALLDLEQKKGNLLFRDEVEKALVDTGKKIRDVLNERSRDVSEMMATMTDARAIKVLLDESDRVSLERIRAALTQGASPVAP